MKSIETLRKISRIVSLIRDPQIRATQAMIARDLNCTDRQVRHYFGVLAVLDCPLTNHGRNGWRIGQWDLWVALKKYCEEK